MPHRRPWRESLPPDVLRWIEEASYAFNNSVDPLQIVRTIVVSRENQNDLLRLAVRDARRAGASWADLGVALKMSRQQAHRTWAAAIEDPDIPDEP